MEQITIDLIPNGKMPMLHASQYDDGRQVRINLTENRQAYTLTGNEVLSLAVRKADNTLVTMDIANVYGGKSYVEFATTEQMCACAGMGYGELRIKEADKDIGTLNFTMWTEQSPEEGGVRSDSEIENLNSQIDRHLDDVLPEQLAEAVPPVVERVVGENYYNKSETNSLLDNKVNNNEFETLESSLYNSYSTGKKAVVSFISPLANPVEFEAEFGANVSGVSEATIYQLGGNFFDKNAVTNGKMINGAGNEVSYADWNLSDYIPVIEGFGYYIYGLTAHPNTNQDNFELFDVNKNKVGFANVKTNEQPYTIPSGVKYIKCCVKNQDLDTAQVGVYQNASYSPFDDTINTTLIGLGTTYYNGGTLKQDKAGHRTVTADGVTTNLPAGEPLVALIGTNNVFADTGDIEVLYWIPTFYNKSETDAALADKADQSEVDSIEAEIYRNHDVVIDSIENESLSGINNSVSITKMKQSNKYRIFVKFSGEPDKLTAIKTASSTSGSGEVDDITSLFVGDSWTAGKTAIYTASADNLIYLKFKFNSSYTGNLKTTFTIYDYTKEITPFVDEVNSYAEKVETEVQEIEPYINLNEAYNLLPPDGYTAGKFISTTGIISSHATRVLSDYIEIDASQGYICNWAKTVSVDPNGVTGIENTFERNLFAFFDEDKNVIPFTGDTTTPSKAIPNNAKYIRVTVLSESLYPLARLIYGNYVSQPKVRIVDYKKVYKKPYFKANTGFEDFDMVMFGDSITHGNLSGGDDGISYVDYANDYLNSKILNVGFGGTRMTHSLSGAGLFCFYHLCECIVSSDVHDWDSLIAYATNDNTSYLPHLQSLMSVDWSKVKAIGLMYGANDYTSNTPVGSTYNETVSNYDGACAYGLKKLLTKYPHLQVIILSPFDREMTLNDPETMTDRLANTAGLLMSDYGDSLENVVSRFHCPLIRTDKLFGINEYNILQYATDGTHPRTNMAQKRLGWLFAQAIKNNLTPFN